MGMAEQMIEAFNSNMAQRIINGTDKINLEPKKYYVYIVPTKGLDLLDGGRNHIFHFLSE